MTDERKEILAPEIAKKALKMQDEMPAGQLEIEEKNRRAFDNFTAFIAAHNYSRDELSKASAAAKGEAVPAAKKAGTNKKKWDDAKLKALWKESIMPGATSQSLATKYGVTRQRIATLLKTANEKSRAGNSWFTATPQKSNKNTRY